MVYPTHQVESIGQEIVVQLGRLLRKKVKSPTGSILSLASCLYNVAPAAGVLLYVMSFFLLIV